MFRWNYRHGEGYETILYKQGIKCYAYISFGAGLDFGLLVWRIDDKRSINVLDRMILHTVIPLVPRQKVKKIANKVLAEAGFEAEINKSILLKLLDNIDWWHLAHD